LTDVDGGLSTGWAEGEKQSSKNESVKTNDKQIESTILLFRLTQYEKYSQNAKLQE
jgi:hypothetical protein